VSLYALLTVDNAQSHVTAFRPISEAARSWSDDNYYVQAYWSDESRDNWLYHG